MAQNPADDGMLHTLAEQIAVEFTRRGATLVTAESCSGGWIAKTLTDIAGSSAWFECGVVAYSYEAKEALLGVRPETLEEHGAVSRETAIEMVSGALARYGATVAVAVTTASVVNGPLICSVALPLTPMLPRSQVKVS